MERDPARPPAVTIKGDGEYTRDTCFGLHSGKLPIQNFGLPCTFSWFSLSLRYSCVCFLWFSLVQSLPASSWEDKCYLCSKGLNTFRVSESSEDIYKSCILRLYVPLSRYKSCVCDWERGWGGGGERKEAMTNGILGEEGRRRCPFLSPTLFWLVIPHPTASAGQKNSDISSAPAQGNDVVAQNNKCKQVALSIHLSPPSPQLFGQIIRGGENIRWKEQSPGWWRCWEVS